MGTVAIPGRQVDEQDLTQSLTASVACSILAAAGPQRSRVLATLYKDERTASLPMFPILEKVRISCYSNEQGRLLCQQKRKINLTRARLWLVQTTPHRRCTWSAFCACRR